MKVVFYQAPLNEVILLTVNVAEGPFKNGTSTAAKNSLCCRKKKSVIIVLKYALMLAVNICLRISMDDILPDLGCMG